MEFFQKLLIDAGTIVKSFGPAFRNYFDQVFVSFQIFCQNDEMPAARINFIVLRKAIASCNITFTSDDGLEEFLLGFGELLLKLKGEVCIFLFVGFFKFAFQIFYFGLNGCIFFRYIIDKFLDAVHGSVVGQRNGFHAIFHGFVHQSLDACLTIEKRILRVNV